MQHSQIKKVKKVELDDYDVAGDIRSRLVLSDLTKDEVTFIEELLYLPLKVSFDTLRSLCHAPCFDETMKKLQAEWLLYLHDGVVYIDKERRKYFEIQIERFVEDFTPSLSYLQDLLRLQELDTLLSWHHIPRTASNIFEALLAKHFSTPTHYERHLKEYFYQEGMGSLYELLEDGGWDLPARNIAEMMGLGEVDLQKLLIQLEWNLIGISYFALEEDRYEQRFSFFEEYKKFTSTFQRHECRPKKEAMEEDYAYVHELTKALESLSTENIGQEHLDRLALFGFIKEAPGGYRCTTIGKEWLGLDIEQRSHILFKHPKSTAHLESKWPDYSKETNLIAIQKCLAMLSNTSWYDLSSFMNASYIPLLDENAVTLKKVRGEYTYPIANYDDREKVFVREVVCEWLYQSGITDVQLSDSEHYIRLTKLGCSILK